MKKIIGIIAAVAMAASVFAVDFSGALKVNGDLFNMSFSGGAKPTALQVGHGGGGMYWGSRIQTSISADKAGCQFALGGETWAYYAGFSVWVQPIDMLKITFLNTDSKLNQRWDYLDDEPLFKAAGSWNFELKPADAITVNLVLGSPWLNNGSIGDTGLTFKYGADFGTIGAIVKFSQTGAKSAAAAKWVDKDNKEVAAPTDFDEYSAIINNGGKYVAATDAADATNNFGFGVGYSGTFDPVSMFVDVGLDMPGLTGMTLVAEAQVVVPIDALKISAYVNYHNDLKNSDFMSANTLGVWADLRYTMDAATPFIKITDKDLLAKDLGLTVTPGIDFNIGAASCEVAAQFDIAFASGTSTVKLSVPFWVEVAF